jgi:hypothetical protein
MKEFNIPSTQTNRLQLVLSSAARAVTKTPMFHHITPRFKSLDWLNINERIQYKVLLLTYETLSSSRPAYLHCLVTLNRTPSNPSHLRITNRSFYHTAPALGNRLPPELRQLDSSPSTSPLAICPLEFGQI